MITSNFRKHTKGLLGLCLMIFALTSCTYDYFKDENNFRLYVPQIEDGSIQNLYVAFHSENGTHAITREFTAPFDKDDLMMQGILRFKVPPGEYTVSCFANYTSGSITTGNAFDESYQTKETCEGDDVYASRTTNPRSVFTTATAYPIGHPDAQVPVELSLDENRLFKGAVVLSFINLPTVVSRIDTYYSGLATAYHFNGSFRRFTTNDRIKGSYSVAENTNGNNVEITDIINPSTGTDFGVVARSRSRAALKSPNPTSLELEIHLYDAADNKIGIIPFTEADFISLTDDKKPLDQNGVVVSDLILKSQQVIKFTFKGFTIVSIDLLGWGDIHEGETTTM